MPVPRRQHVFCSRAVVFFCSCDASRVGSCSRAVSARDIIGKSMVARTRRDGEIVIILRD